MSATDRPDSTSDHSVVRVGLIQHACGPDPKHNTSKAVDMIRQAAKAGAQIVCTQELFTSVYFPQAEDTDHFALAQPIPSPTTDLLGRLANELDIEIVASVFEKRAPGVYHNTCIIISPSQDHPNARISCRYRKMHIPDDPRFYEKFYFTPGDAGDQAWQAQPTRHAVTGVLICWDQWFPEAARLTALKGAQILFYPTAIGWYHAESRRDRICQQEAWQIMHRSHAIANGVFVTAINRVGVEDELEFWGSSFVVDPTGTVIAQATAHDEQVILADCDLDLVEQARQDWPFFRDRRIDAFDGLTKRYMEP